MAVMVSTPCIAQVEPEGIFSIDGTAWSVSGIELFISIPSHFETITGNMEFYQEQVYGSSTSNSLSGFGGHYVDLGFVSIAYEIYYHIFDFSGYFFLAIMQPPIGLGMFTVLAFHSGGCGGFPYPICYPPAFGYQIGIMFKTDDNWTPPGVE